VTTPAPERVHPLELDVAVGVWRRHNDRATAAFFEFEIGVKELGWMSEVIGKSGVVGKSEVVGRSGVVGKSGVSRASEVLRRGGVATHSQGFRKGGDDWKSKRKRGEGGVE
jgi:hypothetical protein